ncbi:MAG: hypothetical protein IT563_18370 [Alphaproteobacteria bacterium]|nr:hypothetical protein [Alphaproteobacteria bacterium]
MAAAAIKTYADTQLKKINDKIAKLEGEKVEVAAKRARLASSCRKWIQAKYNAR